MREIEQPDVIRRMAAENPWWEPNATPIAWTLKPRAYFTIFYPLVVQEQPRRAVVLLGPRRVGKTVLLHHATQRLIGSGIDPRSICYLAVDNPIYNQLDIPTLLGGLSQATGREVTDGPSYVLLDEIQYLRDWERHLKSAVDSYPKVKFIVSGSAAAALRLKSTESGAGRFTDFLLPPLTFHEFLVLLGEDELVQSASPDSPTHSSLDLARLNDRFIDYLNFGGYPETVLSDQVRADPTRFIKSDIIDKVLLRDLPSLYGIENIQELNYLFTTLAFNTAGEVSLEDLSRKSGVAKNTIRKYVQYLEAAFLVKVIHRVDQSARRFQRATYFKIYLTNPSMYAALFSPVGHDEKPVQALAETAVFSQWFHLRAPQLFYARWDKGEIDIVSVGANQRPRWVVEVKWSDRYIDHMDELSALTQFCGDHRLKNATVTSQTRTGARTQGGTQFHFVPAAIYCYTVGYNLIQHQIRNASDEPAVSQLELGLTQSRSEAPGAS